MRDQMLQGLPIGTEYVEYSSNNSGGDWWLKDEDWKALEAAGWVIHWIKDAPDPYTKKTEERWLGALAKEAHRVGLTMGQAIAEWERVTGQNSADLGCACCGAPHSFSRHRVRARTEKERVQWEEWKRRTPQYYEGECPALTSESVGWYSPSHASTGDRYEGD